MFIKTKEPLSRFHYGVRIIKSRHNQMFCYPYGLDLQIAKRTMPCVFSFDDEMDRSSDVNKHPARQGRQKEDHENTMLVGKGREQDGPMSQEAPSNASL